jgi:hypothetical protein
MKHLIIAIVSLASLATLSTSAYAGYGEAAVSGVISGVISGGIQAAAKPRPVIVNQPTKVVRETHVVKQTKVVHLQDKSTPASKPAATSQNAQSAGGRVTN